MNSVDVKSQSVVARIPCSCDIMKLTVKDTESRGNCLRENAAGTNRELDFSRRTVSLESPPGCIRESMGFFNHGEERLRLKLITTHPEACSKASFCDVVAGRIGYDDTIVITIKGKSRPMLSSRVKSPALQSS